MITTAIKTFEYMTLKELHHLKKKYLIQRYNEEIDKLKTDIMTKDIVESNYGAPIIEIIEEVEETKSEIRNRKLFPNQPVVVYSGIKEVKAAKDYTCDFSGATIKTGSLYINYRPMVKNISNGDVYVLQRTIRTELAYESELPTDISELEEFNEKIENYKHQYNSEIQYDYLYKTGGLQFKKLSRRKYENRNNK